MKKVLCFLTVAAILNLGLLAGAHAFSLTGVNNDQAINFDFIGASYGTTYAQPPNSGDVSGGADGTSDGWGIGNTISIYQDNYFNPLWTPSGDTIDFVYGGLDDNYAYFDTVTQTWTINKQAATANSRGAYLDIYYDPSPASTDYTPGPGASDPNGDGTPWDVGEAGEELLLSLQFVPGVINGDPNTVLASSFSVDWLKGSGLGYLEVVGGSWKDQLDSNKFLNGSADFQFGYSAGDLDGLPFANQSPNPWTAEIDGIATGNAVPIPATIWLLGSCLLGFIGLGRRRLNK
jgi:hypothetical protein